MDVQKSKKLDPIRIAIPFIGGAVLLLFANIIAFERGNSNAIVNLLTSMAAFSGLFLIGIGSFAIKMRKWMYSVEERISAIEEAQK